MLYESMPVRAWGCKHAKGAIKVDCMARPYPLVSFAPHHCCAPLLEEGETESW